MGDNFWGNIACVVHDMIIVIKRVMEWKQDENTMLTLKLKMWACWFTNHMA